MKLKRLVGALLSGLIAAGMLALYCLVGDLFYYGLWLRERWPHIEMNELITSGFIVASIVALASVVMDRRVVLQNHSERGVISKFIGWASKPTIIVLIGMAALTYSELSITPAHLIINYLVPVPLLSFLFFTIFEISDQNNKP